MTTKLDGALKREVMIGGMPYTVTIDPQGLKLTPKGKRKGYELEWDAFVNGEAALATALNASIAAAPEPPAVREQAAKPAKAPAVQIDKPAPAAKARPAASEKARKTPRSRSG